VQHRAVAPLIPRLSLSGQATWRCVLVSASRTGASGGCSLTRGEPAVRAAVSQGPRLSCAHRCVHKPIATCHYQTPRFPIAALLPPCTVPFLPNYSLEPAFRIFMCSPAAEIRQLQSLQDFPIDMSHLSTIFVLDSDHNGRVTLQVSVMHASSRS
jgi:hypothetical protein